MNPATEAQLLACGDQALLVDRVDPVLLPALAAAVRGPTVLDAVPAASTLLVRYDPRRTDATQVGATVRAALSRITASTAAPTAPSLRVPVHYDGTDLAEVAELAGLSVEETVARHLAGRYTVAFCGFAPGFGYLTGLDPALRLPRLATPRTRVPAGAVAVAGEYTAVYPRSTPGGWRLIGRTELPLFDPAADPPTPIAPGVRVRFTAATGRAAPVAESAPARPVDTGQPGAHLLAVGALTTVQDLGRPGYGALGIGRSGAADRAALALANRLVGNPEGAAGLESVLGGLEIGFDQPRTVAWTGASGPAWLNGRPVAPNAPVTVPAGQSLRIGQPETGLRTCLAIRGGIEVAPFLGSRASDLLAGLGPAPLRPGDRLPLGPTRDLPPPLLDVAPVARPTGGDLLVRIRFGPREDWFTPAARTALTTGWYQVAADSDRTGLRLAGPPLTRSRHQELPSEGLVPGAIQVTPAGQPVVFLADHPVTGGYPVLAVVAAADLDRLAQLRPGQRLGFRGTPRTG